MLWKLAEYKREQMLNLLEKGKSDKGVVKRPIFDNLFMMQFKNDPEKWQNMNYEEYLDNTIRYVKKNEDPFYCDVDEFCAAIKLIEQHAPELGDKDRKGTAGDTTMNSSVMSDKNTNAQLQP